MNRRNFFQIGTGCIFGGLTTNLSGMEIKPKPSYSITKVQYNFTAKPMDIFTVQTVDFLKKKEKELNARLVPIHYEYKVVGDTYNQCQERLNAYVNKSIWECVLVSGRDNKILHRKHFNSFKDMYDKARSVLKNQEIDMWASDIIPNFKQLRKYYDVTLNKLPNAKNQELFVFVSNPNNNIVVVPFSPVVIQKQKKEWIGTLDCFIGVLANENIVLGD